jgi:hypothetical protein
MMCNGYTFNNLSVPRAQLGKMFSAPFQRQLKGFEKKQPLYNEFAEKILVLKIAAHPIHSTAELAYAGVVV